jgi:hypothetical protein
MLRLIKKEASNDADFFFYLKNHPVPAQKTPGIPDLLR